MTTTVTKQQSSTIQALSKREQQPRSSLAQAVDPERALHLSPNFQPDIDTVIAEGVIAFGVKGSGKSNLLALFAEQIGRFLLPQIIFDTEREYQSLLHLLPRGVLATASRCPNGADILHKGLQVIVDLHSWQSDETAALAMCQLIDELFAATVALAPSERVPCVVHLDEAAYWLPQEAVTYLSKETRKMVADGFHKLATRGRKQGLTPFLYTQSISEVTKSAIRQAGVKVLMRQTLDIDLSRYCQYIQGATSKTKKAIAAFPSGRAIVLLPDGSQHKVQFHQRQSEHVSQTPQAQTALVKFATMQIDVAAIPMRDLTASLQPEHKSPYQSRKPAAAPHQPITDQVYDLLSRNPTLRVVDLMKLAGCSKTTASRARMAFLAKHPDLAAQAKPVKGQNLIAERVAALLSVDPSLRPVELRKLAGCSQSAASKARIVYFEQHPDRTPVHKTVTERIYELLAENPRLRVIDLWKMVGCDQALAGRARRAYFAAHPEQDVREEKGQ